MSLRRRRPTRTSRSPAACRSSSTTSATRTTPRRSGRRATSSPGARASRPAATSPRTWSSTSSRRSRAAGTSPAWPPPAPRATVPAGGGTPIITCRTTGRSGLRLRDAWVDVRFTKEGNPGAFFLRAGQEKRPYSRYELTSSTNLPSIERGGRPGPPDPGLQRHLRRRGLPLARRRREPPVRVQAQRPPARHGQGRGLQRPGREPQRRQQQEELRGAGHGLGHAEARRRRVLVRP